MATALVTAGPTREHLDDVRFLSNGSSGRMGYAIAEALRDGGHEVHLVAGPTELARPAGIDFVPVVSALEMQQQVERLFPRVSLVFAVAAVADHRPSQRAPGKPAKAKGSFTIELVPNPDILAELGRKKGSRTLVGFA